MLFSGAEKFTKQNVVVVDKYILHIHTDLKLSTHHQSSLEMTRRALDRPNHNLRAPQGPQVAPTGLSGGVWATQRPVGTSQGDSEAMRTTSGQYKYVLVYFGTRFCFANISAP